MTTERVIEAVGVRKNYRGGTEGAGLNGFDLEVTAGTVTGLLGPNGAGKGRRYDGGSDWSGSTPRWTRSSPGGRTW